MVQVVDVCVTLRMACLDPLCSMREKRCGADRIRKSFWPTSQNVSISTVQIPYCLDAIKQHLRYSYDSPFLIAACIPFIDSCYSIQLS